MELVISFLTGLALVELYAWLPAINRWLLDVAIRRLPEPDRERCEEEWNAALEALPTTLLKLWHAASFVVAAYDIKADVMLDEARRGVDEIVAVQARLAQRFAAMRLRLDKFPTAHRELGASMLNVKEKKVHDELFPMIQQLDEAWSKSKRNFEAVATDCDVACASVAKAATYLGRSSRGHKGPLLYWRTRIALRHVEREMDSACSALGRAANNTSVDKAFDEYCTVTTAMRQTLERVLQS